MCRRSGRSGLLVLVVTKMTANLITDVIPDRIADLFSDMRLHMLANKRLNVRSNAGAKCFWATRTRVC